MISENNPEKMKHMPAEIKRKLRQYAKVQIQSYTLANEIDKMIESYGVPVENLIGMGDITWNCEEPQTEALAFLHNGECDNINQTISEIEKVFLWFVNNQ